MKIVGTDIAGVHVIESEAYQDARGAFSRLFCAQELAPVLEGRTIVQVNHSRTHQVGAIRGLHYQRAPHAEMKIVRCVRGRVFDVAVDLRRDSPTFLSWTSLVLTPESHLAFILPEGCAHGFQVLDEDSEMLYLHTALYTPDAEGSVRFDDPRVGVAWPLEPTDISAKDRGHAYIEENFRGLVV